MLQPTTFALYPDKGGGDKEGKTTGSEGSCSCSLKITWANECEIKEVDRSNARPFKRPHLQSGAVKIYILGVNVIWGFSWVTLALVWSANIGISRCSDTERRDVSRVLTWRPAGYSTPADLQDHVTGSSCSSWNTCRGWRMSCIFNVSDIRVSAVVCGTHRFPQKSCAFPLDTKISRFVYFVYFCTSLHRNSSTDKQRWRQGTRSFSNPPPHAKMMGSKSCFILKNRQKNLRLLKCFLTALLPNLQGQQWTSSAPDCSSATVWWVSMKFCTDIFIVPRLKRGEIAWTVKNLWLLTWLPTTEQIHQSLSLHFCIFT